MTWIAMLLACSFEPACAGPPAPQAPQEQEPTPDKKSRLTDLTIEDLMRIEVTSAARKPERLVDTASAIFVIRNDDILRSGVRSVPEALRMAPGIEVARIDANKWSVTARGSGGMFANKLLVLVDGRSVYNPTFSGVHWDVQDLMLEDVDRIEVIRGPGATVWGANAVNGVINIITKKASETQGGVATGGGGTQERGFGAARLGGKIGDRTYYRVFAKYFDRADSEGGNDLSKLGHTGMRLDWNPEDSDTLTLQGDYYRGTMGVDRFAAMLLPPFQEEQFTSSRVSGGNLLARWTHEAGPKNVLAAQFYYDRTDRNAPWNRETRDTLDFDLHHAIPLLEGHDVTWGLGLRWTRGEFGNTFTSQVIPDTKVDQISSAFLQDEISLVPGALLLTLGSKFEYNNYTRLEILPNARLLCTLAEDQVVWLAASRAVRTPAPADTRARFNQAVMPPPGPGFPPTLISIFGDPRFRSEELTAYELGYRTVPTPGLSLDAAAFFNVYDHLRSVEPGTPGFEASPAPAHTLVPFTLENEIKGRTYGAEVSAHFQILEGWRIQGSYSFFKMNLQPKRGSLDTNSANADRADPIHQVHLRSSIDLASSLRFDAVGRFTSRVPTRSIASYFESDARLAWDLRENIEVSLVGQNLVHRRHFESDNPPLSIRAMPVERGAYASLLWRF